MSVSRDPHPYTRRTFGFFAGQGGGGESDAVIACGRSQDVCAPVSDPLGEVGPFPCNLDRGVHGLGSARHSHELVVAKDLPNAPQSQQWTGSRRLADLVEPLGHLPVVGTVESEIDDSAFLHGFRRGGHDAWVSMPHVDH